MSVIPNQNPSLPPVPSPLPNGYLSTARLAVSLAQLCAMLTHGLGLGCGGQGVEGAGRRACSRKFLIISRLIGRTVAVIVKSESHNRRLSLKRAMLACPHWRARVVSDLGGEAALLRWEALAAKCGALQVTAKADRPAGLLLARERARHMARLRYLRGLQARAAFHPHVYKDAVRVDREALFRLAPIARRSAPRAHRARQSVNGQAYPRSHGRAEGFTPQVLRVNPISLLPRELRLRRATKKVRDCVQNEELYRRHYTQLRAETFKGSGAGAQVALWPD